MTASLGALVVVALLGAESPTLVEARLPAAAVAPLLAADAPPLVEAAKARDWAELRALVARGADPNAAEADGATALHWAAYWDDVEVARLLLAAGADARAANDLGATPLWNAALNGSAAMVRVLLAAGADPNAPLLSAETPVMTAARAGGTDALALLLEAGGEPNARATRDQTALMWAAAQGHAGTVELLVRHGADVHARSATWTQVMAVPPHADAANQQNVPHGGQTALLFAVRAGHVGAARALLAAGANPNDAEAWGVSATVLAAHSGFGELVALLLEAGADPNAAGAGFSALHLAVLRRDLEVARTLLAHGADPEARLANWTPTRRASADWSIHPSLVGATSFWIAARLGQPDMMRLLAAHGADPLFVHEVTWVGLAGTFGAERYTEAHDAVMAAAGMGGPRNLGGFIDPPRAAIEGLALEAVKVALELGVAPDREDLDGWTAAERSRFPTVRAFLEQVAAAR